MYELCPHCNQLTDTDFIFDGVCATCWKARAEAAESKLATLPDKIVEAVIRFSKDEGEIADVFCVECGSSEIGPESDYICLHCKDRTDIDCEIHITETQLRAAVERAVKEVAG